MPVSRTCWPGIRAPVRTARPRPPGRNRARSWTQLHIRHVAIARAQGAHQLLRLVARIEPVGAEADHQEARPHAFEPGRPGPLAVGEVEIIHRLGDVEVGIGVEAADELAAAVAQVVLHLEVDFKIEPKRLFAAQAAAELLAHGVVAHVGDVAHHARHGQAAARQFLAVIIAGVPVGVGHDRLAAHFIEGDLLGAVARGGGDGNGGHHAVGERYRPFERLHAAHRPPVTASSRSMPRASSSMACSRTMSPMVITGKDMA
jgi:hypothetical protein